MTDYETIQVTARAPGAVTSRSPHMPRSSASARRSSASCPRSSGRTWSMQWGRARRRRRSGN